MREWFSLLLRDYRCCPEHVPSMLLYWWKFPGEFVSNAVFISLLPCSLFPRLVSAQSSHDPDSDDEDEGNGKQSVEMDDFGNQVVTSGMTPQYNAGPSGAAAPNGSTHQMI